MSLNLQRSLAAFQEACEYIPGGVNSPVRSYRNIGSTPPFIAKAQGSHIFDIDGNEYIDYVGSWGPIIVGHAHPLVVEAICKAAESGTSYGAPTLLETEVAKKVSDIMPNLELIRMVNSGTEATMSALRVARGYTGREKIVKFIGCYHGHHDSLLVKAGSGGATFGQPDSPGVPADIAKNTITVPYNDLPALQKVIAECGQEIAAIIIEPVAGNMGLVLPREGYLAELRKITEDNGILLIFDEVMCGFRAALGGAQAKYNIKPDLTCLGKIIGGGLPVGAYGGKKEIMSIVAPAGPVYQAGTLSGNPLAMAAGLATLKIVSEEGYTEKLTKKTTLLVEGLAKVAAKAGITVQFSQAGSMFGFFFNQNKVENYELATQSDLKAFKTFFLSMLEQGIYMAPSQFETVFMSGAHTEEDLENTIKAAEIAFQKVADLQ